MRQKGFFLPALPMMAWGAIAAGVVIAGLTIAVWVQSERLETSKAETVATQGRFDAFVAQAKALGDAQAEKAKAEDTANKQRQEKANAALTKSRSELAGVYDAYRRLRDQRENTGGRVVSAAPTFTASADRTCFDSKELVGSIRGLETGILRILQQGDQAIIDLGVAKAWAIKTP